MKNTEDGLNVRDGHAYVPLADAAPRCAVRPPAAYSSTDFSTTSAP